MSLGGLEIGHLVDVEPLAQGRRTDLVAATDLKLERRVAVRLLPPAIHAEDRARFLDRARAAAALSRHPNIVTIYDAGITEDNQPYLVLELADGPDLATQLETAGPLPWPEAADLAAQLASGLGAIHETGACYRRLRPENVLFTGARVKLGDLGLLPSTDHEPDTPETLVHRAPEMLDGAGGDERSDLYSLTSVLYQVIDGRAPLWRPNDAVEALTSRLQTESAPPLDPDLVPAALAVFITAGLSADPLDRPQSVTEFSRELELIRQGRTTGSTPSVLHQATATIPAGLSTPGLIDPTEVLVTEGLPLPTAQPASTSPASPSPSSPSGPASHVANGWPAPGDDTVASWMPPPGSQMPDPGPGPGPDSTSEPTVMVPPVEMAMADAFDTGPAPLIPLESEQPGDARGPERNRTPLLIGAGAMIVVGLLALVAIVALGLRGNGTDAESAAPALTLPGGETVAGAEGIEGEATDTTLTPLAMLAESTTSTVPDGEVTSTNTMVRRADVPNLVGTEVAGAGQILSDAGFEVLVVGRVSPGALPGTVVQQSPAAGTTVELPATVTLFIPRSTTLPFMIGRPADTVCLQLEALGLTCQQTLRFDDRVPPGAVVSTDPAEGASFTPGQTIRLQVSRGPLVEAALPQVAGMSEADARAALGALGFIAITTVTVTSENVPTGLALGTEPAAGTRLTIDQAVVIQISSGPVPKALVPNVVGLDQAAAQAALTTAQLTTTFVGRELPAGDPGIGVVLTVSPGVGTEVDAGSTVTVTVGQTAAATTTTTMASTSTTAAEAEG